MQETQVWSLGQEDPLEKEIETHLQYSCLGNPMDRGAWQATVNGAAKKARHNLATKTKEEKKITLIKAFGINNF